MVQLLNACFTGGNGADHMFFHCTGRKAEANRDFLVGKTRISKHQRFLASAQHSVCDDYA